MGGKYPGAEAILAVRDALQQLSSSNEPVSLGQLQEAAPNVAKTKVRSVLSMMKDVGIVREVRGSKYALAMDAALGPLEEIAGRYAARQQADRDKLHRMALYAQSAGCRWKLLLEYFNEADGFDRCGTCDNCVHPLEAQIAPPVNRERTPTFS
jgi:ATP-dependent DNA helicase RecQ